MASSDLTKYKTDDEAVAAWQKTSTFLHLMPKQRAASIQNVRDKWAMAMSDKEQAALEAQNGPDLVGRTNEEIGQFLDKNVGFDTGLVARALLPNSNAQALIDAAMMVPGVGEIGVGGKILEAAPEVAKPAARLAMRLFNPTVAGAVGGATSGDAKGGAESGLAQGAGGEATSLLLGIGKRSINRMDMRRLSEWLKPVIGKDLPDADAYYRAFKGNKIVQDAEAMMDATKQKIMKKIGQRPIFTYDLTPEQANELNANASTKTFGARPGKNFGNLQHAHDILTALDRAGWDYNGEPTTKAAGKIIRNTTHQIEGEIATQLDQIDPKLATEWYTNRGKLRTTQTLTNMFNEKGVIDNGYVDMSRLQDLVGSDYKLDLQQAMGTSQAGNLNSVVQTGEKQRAGLSNVLHRGAAEGRQDVVGHPPIGRFYAHSTGLTGFFHMPKLSRHVGYLPADLGRGKAISAAATLGPYRFVRAVQNFFGIGPTGDSTHTSLPTREALPKPTPGSSASALPEMHITKSPEEMKATIAGAG